MLHVWQNTGDIGKAYSEPSQKYELELSEKLINSWKPFNYFLKKLYLRCMSGFWIHLCTRKGIKLSHVHTYKHTNTETHSKTYESRLPQIILPTTY